MCYCRFRRPRTQYEAAEAAERQQNRQYEAADATTRQTNRQSEAAEAATGIGIGNMRQQKQQKGSTIGRIWFIIIRGLCSNSVICIFECITHFLFNRRFWVIHCNKASIEHIAVVDSLAQNSAWCNQYRFLGIRNSVRGIAKFMFGACRIQLWALKIKFRRYSDFSPWNSDLSSKQSELRRQNSVL